MSTFTGNTVSSGATILASDHNTLVALLTALLNGNIDANNLADSAVTTVKITDDAVTAPKLSGIDKSNLTTDSNPYKFSAYASASHNVGTAATKVQFDTENFDTNNNYDTTNFRYVAPVNGFYQFNTNILTTTAGAGTNLGIFLLKNGVTVVGPVNIQASAGYNPGAALSAQLSLVATDYVEVFVATGAAAKALDAGATTYNIFSGFLVSRT